MLVEQTKAVLEFDRQEAQEIVDLLDIAVRAQGLAVAAVALKYASTFQQAFATPPALPEDHSEPESP